MMEDIVVIVGHLIYMVVSVAEAYTGSSFHAV